MNYTKAQKLGAIKSYLSGQCTGENREIVRYLLLMERRRLEGSGATRTDKPTKRTLETREYRARKRGKADAEPTHTLDADFADYPASGFADYPASGYE